MSRRTTRTRAVFSSWPVARWKRRLNCSFLSLSTSSSIWSSVIALTSCAFMALLGDAFDETGLDRQLGGGERQRFLSDADRNAVDFEQNTDGLDAAYPKLGRALAFAHADFDRFLRHRHVRINADPHPARPFHKPGERAARSLDLTRGDALGLQRLEAILAEGEGRARGGDTVDAALERLAELGAGRLQHDLTLVVPLGRGVAARAALIAFGELLVLRHRIVLEDFALEDPDLDAAGAVSGERGGDAVIDVGAQCVQRHAAFAVPLHARDFGAAETARAVDADALGAETHGGLHRALHGAAERHAALELLRDRFGDQLRVELGLADFDDVDDHIAVGELGHGPAQVLDVGALLADHHAGTRRVDGDAALLVRTLDDDLRHCRLLELLHQLLADLDVLVQQRAVFGLAGVPARVPGTVDPETQPDWIDFLTHERTLRLSLRFVRRPDAR